MEILEPHGRRFEAALELLREGGWFAFDGVRFSLSSQGQLVVAIELSRWPIDNLDEQTASSYLQRAESVAEYLAAENPAFDEIFRQRPRLFLLVNYFGRGGEAEIARLIDGRVVRPTGIT